MNALARLPPFTERMVSKSLTSSMMGWIMAHTSRSMGVYPTMHSIQMRSLTMGRMGPTPVNINSIFQRFITSTSAVQISNDVPSTIMQLLQRGTERLAASSLRLTRKQTRIEARALLHACIPATRNGVSSSSVELELRQRDVVTSDISRSYEAMLDRRIVHKEPVAYITEEKEFWGIQFHTCTKSNERGNVQKALIPRPESELMIEAANSHLHSTTNETSLDWVCDLGTGSGCLMGALLSQWSDLSGLGIDISADALSIARMNMNRLGVSDRSYLLQSHWTSELRRGESIRNVRGTHSSRIPYGRCSIILCNPPYVAHGDLSTLDPSITCHEPVDALDGGHDGYQPYRELCISTTLKQLLSPNGRLILEVGEGQEERVIEMFVQDGSFLHCETRHDYQDIPRCIIFKRILEPSLP